MKHILRHQHVLRQLHSTRRFSNVVGPEPQCPSRIRRIFSGIQPTGRIHLGNYLGAIRKWVEFQSDPTYKETIYSIVDLHAITLPQKPDELERAIFEATATLIACGIDPDKSILFLQSHVEAHTQLAWVLGSLTTMPRLAQLPQFKEKSKSLKEIPLGLYTYPVLQAADILIYNATEVPIGEDNLQHIQLASHLARGFNRTFGETFLVPKAIVEDGMSGRLRSLRKPENKMSKSEPDPKSRIGLVDTPEEILEKVKKAVTDFTSEVTYDQENRPGVSNLLEMHSLCTGTPINDIVASVTHLNTGEYKLVIADVLIEFLRPVRSKVIDLLQNSDTILSILEKGEARAKSISDPIWEEVCKKVGISPRKSLNSRLLKVKQ